jgi:hypothetical protein
MWNKQRIEGQASLFFLFGGFLFRKACLQCDQIFLKRDGFLCNATFSRKPNARLHPIALFSLNICEQEGEGARETTDLGRALDFQSCGREGLSRRAQPRENDSRSSVRISETVQVGGARFQTPTYLHETHAMEGRKRGELRKVCFVALFLNRLTQDGNFLSEVHFLLFFFPPDKS